MVFVWIITGLVLFFFVADYALRSYAKYKIADLFENVPPFNVVAEAEIPECRPLTITTSDGLRLSGGLHLPERDHPLGLVIFFPELSGNHLMARRYCDALLTAGYAILGFDFRNQGRSEHQAGYQPIHWVTEFEMRDVAAVLEYIEADSDLDSLPLIAFGVSRGGVAAILSGCRYPRIQAVIADSSFGTMSMALNFVDRFVRYVIPGWLYELLPDWHIRLALRQGIAISQHRRNCTYQHIEDESAGISQTPVLLISGKRDSYVTSHVAQDLQAVIGPNAQLWMVDHAKHNMARATATAEYDRRIVSHCAQALGVPEPPAAGKIAPPAPESSSNSQHAAKTEIAANSVH
ncbi:MAG: alpha/beta fold hydrolase [Planctomyces sp.]|nr:alpha/beta fold hydrolase [Planctomyces sp.]